MRTLLAGERTALQGARYGIYARLEVMNASGSWKDLTALAGVDWLDSCELTTEVDQPTWTATFALKRSQGVLSLSPLMAASALNVNDVGAYAPLLNVGSRVRLSTAFTPSGAPAGGDWRVMFEGKVDIVAWEKDPVTLQCRDLGAILLDTFIETARSYANPLGTAMETVIQSIVNDNIASPPALYVPTSPGTMVTMLDPVAATTNVMEAIRSIAFQIGWDVRYKWSGSAFLLTLYEPNRSTAVAQTSFGPSEYFDIPGASMDKSGIRNVVLLTYVDAITGLVTAVDVEDAGSIAAFGRLPILIDEAATSQITTFAEASDLATSILSDLSSPKVAQTMETSYFWPAELGDVYDFTANAVHYDQAQRFGVVGITHQLTGTGKGRTLLRTRAKPIGAYAGWLMRSTPGGSGGLLPLVPEFLFVNAPVEVVAAGVIVGWKLSGRVDDDTNAVIITLSSSLAIRATAPPFTPPGPVSNPPATEYWMNVAPGGFFTIEVLLTQGGTGQITLVPASVYNPTDAIPPARGGVLGGTYIQTVSRTPITSINTTQPTLTSFAVTLSVRPLSATIKYRFAPDALVGTEAWVGVTDPSGATTFLVDVSAAPAVLEYHSVSVDGIAEEIHHMRLDQGTVPLISNLTLVELTPNVLTASWTINDNVVSWELYAKRAGFPDLAAGVPDPAYLRFTGNRQRTEVSFYAAGTGLVSPDHWQVLVIGYDGYGARSPWAAGSCIVQGTVGTPPAVGALSGLLAVVVNEAGTDYVDVTWVNNAVIEAAAPSRFSVAIVRDDGGLGASAWPAQTDHLGSGTIPGVGGWHHTCTPAAAGASGASLLTLGYTVSLYDIATLVATYTTSVTGWFYVAGLGVPPSGTPTLPVVTVGFPTTITLQANWTGLGLDPTLELEIDWHSSTDSFAVDDQVFLSEILAPNTQVHSARGFIAGQSGRARIRYLNAFGVGPWTAWSNTVASGGPPLP